MGIFNTETSKKEFVDAADCIVIVNKLVESHIHLRNGSCVYCMLGMLLNNIEKTDILKLFETKLVNFGFDCTQGIKCTHKGLPGFVSINNRIIMDYLNGNYNVFFNGMLKNINDFHYITRDKIHHTICSKMIWFDVDKLKDLGFELDSFY